MFFLDHPPLRHHSGHFRHKTAEVWDPHPQYEIDAFGKKLVLELTFNDKFVAPNLQVKLPQSITRKILNFFVNITGDSCLGKLHQKSDARSKNFGMFLYGQSERRRKFRRCCFVM